MNRPKNLLAITAVFLVLASFAAAWAQKSKSDSPAAIPFVVPDLARRLTRLRTVQMPFRASGLSTREQNLVRKLVDACSRLEDIFWRQSDPEGLRLYLSLKPGQNDDLRKYLFINAGRFDLFDGNRTFAGKEPVPPGRGFYPSGLTRERIEEYASRNPAKKQELYSPTTIVRRAANGLEGVPYRKEYRVFLEPAARDLREAADLADDSAFANFLRLRAAALLSDDYYESDLAWVDLQSPKIDVIFAPYETYLDDLLGVKTSYGAAVLIRDDAESARVAAFQKYVPDLQDALPLAPEDRPSKKGMVTPMEVMDAPFRAGDLRHGYQAVADNLPNDPRIHEKKGSKKIFFRNFMDARVRYIILPLAQKLMRPDEARQVTPAGYMIDTLSHEISHGLGPAFARSQGRQMDIREAIGPAYSALEEAKADIVGLLNLHWLEAHRVIPPAQVVECYAAHVADAFRTVRFGLAEAHSRAQMMQFNYFLQQRAIVRDGSGLYAMDSRRMRQAVVDLARELLQMEATGDRARVESWFANYAVSNPELEKALAGVSDVPVDVDPVFDFPEKVR